MFQWFQYSRDNGFIVGVMFRSKSTWSSQARREKQGENSRNHRKKCGKPNGSHPQLGLLLGIPLVMAWFEIPPSGWTCSVNGMVYWLHIPSVNKLFTLHNFTFSHIGRFFWVFFIFCHVFCSQISFFARRMLTWSKFLDMMARPSAAPRRRFMSLQALTAAGPFVATEVALVLRPWVTWESRWEFGAGFISYGRLWNQGSEKFMTIHFGYLWIIWE